MPRITVICTAILGVLVHSARAVERKKVDRIAYRRFHKISWYYLRRRQLDRHVNS